MKVAICIDGNGGFIVECENNVGCFACCEAFSLAAAVGLKINPFDKMFFGHRVVDRADINGYLAIGNGSDGDMLFLTCFDGAGDDLLHFFAAAHHRDARFVYHTY